MKRKIIAFLLSCSIILVPSSVFAYSDQIIVGGDNIGIHIDSKGIMVIGFYKVNGKYLESNPEIRIGDRITKVGDFEVNSISELTNAIEKNLKNDTITLSIERENETLKTKLKLIENEGIYKTGLYVKDGISGIGTLTYIDPSTKIFGTLGHERHLWRSAKNKNI